MTEIPQWTLFFQDPIYKFRFSVRLFYRFPNLAVQTPNNIGIDSVSVDQTSFTRTYAGRVIARIHNYRKDVPVDVQVSVSLNDKEMGRKKLTVPFQPASRAHGDPPRRKDPIVVDGVCSSHADQGRSVRSLGNLGMGGDALLRTVTRRARNLGFSAWTLPKAPRIPRK